MKRVIEGQRRAAGVAEDRVDAAFDKRVEKGFSAVAYAMNGRSWQRGLRSW